MSLVIEAFAKKQHLRQKEMFKYNEKLSIRFCRHVTFFYNYWQVPHFQ